MMWQGVGGFIFFVILHSWNTRRTSMVIVLYSPVRCRLLRETQSEWQSLGTRNRGLIVLGWFCTDFLVEFEAIQYAAWGGRLPRRSSLLLAFPAGGQGCIDLPLISLWLGPWDKPPFAVPQVAICANFKVKLGCIQLIVSTVAGGCSL